MLYSTEKEGKAHSSEKLNEDNKNQEPMEAISIVVRIRYDSPIEQCFNGAVAKPALGCARP